MLIRCTRCKSDKECSDFYPSTLRTFTTWCKECVKTVNKAWAVRNPDKVRARVRTYHRKHRAERSDYAKWRRLQNKYSLTKDQYTVMLAHQEHRCAICDGSLVNQPRVSVDHNHDTGKVRGILCNTCNRGIGLLKDNPAVLTRAAQYVSLSV